MEDFHPFLLRPFANKAVENEADEEVEEQDEGAEQQVEPRLKDLDRLVEEVTQDEEQEPVERSNEVEQQPESNKKNEEQKPVESSNEVEKQPESDKKDEDVPHDIIVSPSVSVGDAYVFVDPEKDVRAVVTLSDITNATYTFSSASGCKVECIMKDGRLLNICVNDTYMLIWHANNQWMYSDETMSRAVFRPLLRKTPAPDLSGSCSFATCRVRGVRDFAELMQNKPEFKLKKRMHITEYDGNAKREQIVYTLLTDGACAFYDADTKRFTILGVVFRIVDNQIISECGHYELGKCQT